MSTIPDEPAPNSAWAMAVERRKKNPLEPGSDVDTPRPPPPMDPKFASLQWRTAKQICEGVGETTVELAPYMVVGELTSIEGFAKDGKTTYVLAMLKAVLDGLPFIGKPTTKSEVVYLTEDAEMANPLKRVGLDEREDFHCLAWAHSFTLDNWNEKVAAGVAKAKSVGAQVLIIDTLAQWAELEDENDNATMLKAMMPLQLAAQRDRLAVGVVRHTKKDATADIAHAGRGASSAAGAVHNIVQVARVTGSSGGPDQRKISYRGRHTDLELEIILQYDDGEFSRLGTAKEAAILTNRKAVFGCIPGPLDGDPITAPQIREQLLEHGTHLSLRTILRALAGMFEAREINRLGHGTSRHDPFSYVRVTVTNQPSQGYLPSMRKD
jgi:hypothetical protein